MIPISKPGHRAGRGGGRPRRPPLRHARDGPPDRPSSRRPGPPTAACGTPSSWPTARSPWRRSSARSGSARATRSSPSASRFNATVSAILQAGATPGLRGHPGGRLLHRPGPGRGGHHAPHEGDHAGPPVRPDGRHGPARRDRRAPRARDRRGRRPGPRRDLPRPPGRAVRAGDVQPLRHEEPDDRRGRLRHDRRRRRSPTGSASTATTACASATTTRRWAPTSSRPTSPPRIGLAQLARLDERTAQRRRQRRLPDRAAWPAT